MLTNVFFLLSCACGSFFAFQGVSCFIRHVYIVNWRETSSLVYWYVLLQNRLLTRPNLTKYYNWESLTNKQTAKSRNEYNGRLLLPCEQALTCEASGEKTCERRALERTLWYSRLPLACCLLVTFHVIPSWTCIGSRLAYIEKAIYVSHARTQNPMTFSKYGMALPVIFLPLFFLLTTASFNSCAFVTSVKLQL